MFITRVSLNRTHPPSPTGRNLMCDLQELVIPAQLATVIFTLYDLLAHCVGDDRSWIRWASRLLGAISGLIPTNAEVDILPQKVQMTM